MNRISRNGYIALGAAGAALLLGGGVAFAFWTSSGTGTGTAAAGTTGSVTVAQNGSIGGLYPGGPAQTITVDITNPNAGAVTLAGVTASVVDTTNSGCTSADFLISGPVYGGGSIAGGATVTANGATIRMVNELARNQDACKGVTVNLAYAAN